MSDKIYRVTDFGVSADSDSLQTEALQAVFDRCKEGGGTVVIPAGRYRTAGLRMWSDTTLRLESGAVLVASETCEDYPVFPIPEGVALHTDMELIPEYYQARPWAEYRRAILSAYGGKNIAVIGEEGSLIDGMDCADPQGEEGYRGPHGLFLTNVENVRLEGYAIQRCGNFMHQIDTCRNVTLQNVVCSGGSDGVHLHHCSDVRIEHCVFHTGDDCIAGINIERMTVRDCEINTSCQAFRCGGNHIHVERCRIWGPGIYPHRMSVVPNRGTESVRDRSLDLPREAGRHNLICVYLHFASARFPAAGPYHDVVFRDCTVDGADDFLNYHANVAPLEAGGHLTELTLENVVATNLRTASDVHADPEHPLVVTLQNVSATFREGATATALFDGTDPHTHVTVIPG